MSEFLADEGGTPLTPSTAQTILPLQDLRTFCVTDIYGIHIFSLVCSELVIQ